MTSERRGEDWDDRYDWDDDEKLLRELLAALRAPGAEPVDPKYLAAGQGAFAWRTIDADLALATLAYDSLLDEELTARARSHGTAQGAPRTLVFEGGEAAVELYVTGDGIAGQLIPARTGQVALYTADGVLAEAAADQIGAFTLPPPPPGPIRLRCRTAAGSVQTDWICL